MVPEGGPRPVQIGGGVRPAVRYQRDELLAWVSGVPESTRAERRARRRHRVSRRGPCPVCERPDWCLFAGPDDSPSAAICARVESDKRAGEGGWLHVLRSDGPTWPGWKRTVRVAARTLGPEPAEKPAPDFASLAAEAEAAIAPEALRRFAEGLGLSPESLRRLSVVSESRRAGRSHGSPRRALGRPAAAAQRPKAVRRGARKGSSCPRSPRRRPALIAEAQPKPRPCST